MAPCYTPFDSKKKIKNTFFCCVVVYIYMNAYMHIVKHTHAHVQHSIARHPDWLSRVDDSTIFVWFLFFVHAHRIAMQCIASHTLLLLTTAKVTYSTKNFIFFYAYKDTGYACTCMYVCMHRDMHVYANFGYLPKYGTLRHEGNH